MPTLHKLRLERFGGIAGTRDPISLVWYSREQLRRLGYDGGFVWEGPSPLAVDGAVGAFLDSTLRRLPASAWQLSSRPVEVELTITTRCPRQCPCCYNGGSPTGRDVPYDVLVERLDYLATLDPFHLALGGGEPLLHPDLLGVAAHARELGMLPSTTTGGSLVTAAWAERAREVLERVNVSVDFPGGPKGYAQADTDQAFRAIAALRGAGVTVGASYVLTRHNVGRLPELFLRSAQAGADSILLLRLKPSGRGAGLYDSDSLMPSQAAGLLAALPPLCMAHDLDFHLDCALAPIVLSSDVPDERLTKWAASGCIAGTLLATVDERGRVHTCSHLTQDVCDVRDLPGGWLVSPVVAAMRARWQRQSGSCAVCRRLAICGGGCAAVNERLGMDLDQPDPDLPCTAD